MKKLDLIKNIMAIVIFLTMLYLFADSIIELSGMSKPLLHRVGTVFSYKIVAIAVAGVSLIFVLKKLL